MVFRLHYARVNVLLRDALGLWLLQGKGTVERTETAQSGGVLKGEKFFDGHPDRRVAIKDGSHEPQTTVSLDGRTGP